MTNKIIETARLAGFFIDEDSRKYQPRCIFHTRYLIDDELARFYALARAEALEDAAQAVKSLTAEIRFQAIEHYKFADAAEKTILALKEQQSV